MVEKKASTNRWTSCRAVKGAAIIGFSALLAACDGASDGALTSGRQPATAVTRAEIPKTPPIATELAPETALTKRFLALAAQQFGAACAQARKLQSSIHIFLSEPNEEHLSRARDAWISAHSRYSATQLFRNLDIRHPVLDRSQIEPLQHSLASRIDQYPLLPGYLDAIEGYPQSGYVFSPLPIDKATLYREHQFTDTHYVTLGFHAIEFLLWGDNRAEPRKSNNYIRLPDSGTAPAEDNPDFIRTRRSRLLALITDLLAEDLSIQCREWQSEQGYYPLQLMTLAGVNQVAAIKQATERLSATLQPAAREKTANIASQAAVMHSSFAASDWQDRAAQSEVLSLLLSEAEVSDRTE